jgi:hypothetical protein
MAATQSHTISNTQKGVTQGVETKLAQSGANPCENAGECSVDPALAWKGTRLRWKSKLVAFAFLRQAAPGEEGSDTVVLVAARLRLLTRLVCPASVSCATRRAAHGGFAGVLCRESASGLSIFKILAPPGMMISGFYS